MQRRMCRGGPSSPGYAELCRNGVVLFITGAAAAIATESQLRSTRIRALVSLGNAGFESCCGLQQHCEEVVSGELGWQQPGPNPFVRQHLQHAACAVPHTCELAAEMTPLSSKPAQRQIVAVIRAIRFFISAPFTFAVPPYRAQRLPLLIIGRLSRIIKRTTQLLPIIPLHRLVSRLQLSRNT